MVSSSATRLVMMCTSENREVKKRIRLVNDSKATATFMFDSLRRPFEANLWHGHIGPYSHKFVTITFAPRENGIYACHFPCLILNHVMGKFGFSKRAQFSLHTKYHTIYNYPIFQILVINSIPVLYYFIKNKYFKKQMI